VSALDTIDVPAEPLAATAAWRAAVAAAGGVCTCTGVCGKQHQRTAGRCLRSLTGGYRLFLTTAGELLCAGCFDALSALRRKTARAAITAPEPVGLFDSANGSLT
jgi:hypothetical protein